MRRMPNRWTLPAAVLLLGGIATGCGPSDAPAHHRVEIRAMTFDPPMLSAAPGDTITWVNHDLVPHTVTAPDGAWQSGELLRGESFTTVWAERDAVEYTCAYHPVMTGAITAR